MEKRKRTMNKILILWWFCLVVVYAFGQDCSRWYYYYSERKICLEVSETKLFVESEKFDVNDIKNAIEKTNIGNIKEIIDWSMYNMFYIAMQHTSKEDMMELQQQLNAIGDVIYASHVFWDSRGVEGASYTNGISVRLKSKEDYLVLQKCAEDYQIKDIEIGEYDELSCYLILPHNPPKNAMDVANELHETGLFMYAVPNIITFWPIDPIPDWIIDPPSNALSYIIDKSSLVYPNPVSEILFIDLDNIVRAQNNTVASYTILLYNSQGNMLHQARAKGGIIQFNISNLANGIYFLHISDGISATSETFKIIVKH